MARSWIVAALIAAAALGAGVWLALTQYGVGDPKADAVQILFAQRLPDPAGRMVDLGMLRGRPAVLNFWATWCAPCVDEMPELHALSKELAAGPTQFVGIGVDTAENIAAFRDRLGIGYPLVVAGMAGTELSRRFGNQSGGLPFTVVLDARGKVRYTKLGRVDIAELKGEIQQALH